MPVFESTACGRINKSRICLRRKRNTERAVKAVTTLVSPPPPALRAFFTHSPVGQRGTPPAPGIGMPSQRAVVRPAAAHVAVNVLGQGLRQPSWTGS